MNIVWSNAKSGLYIGTAITGIILSVLTVWHPFPFPVSLVTSGLVAGMFGLFAFNAIPSLMFGVSRRTRVVAYLTAISYVLVSYSMAI